MPRREQRSECPISLSLEAWGDKWSLLIIRDLMFEGKRTFGDFLKSHERIATNILARRLRSLQDAGLITETGSRGSADRGYALTEKGIDMLPMMLEVYFWAERHYPIPDHVQDILKTVRADRASFVAELSDKLRPDAQHSR